ncbi:hypothetical protein ACFYUD_00645 [Nocardia tengchongensis]|uniref:hypothetical protein n=1 Tax=Nocardia tengchongensis TaxID=2055889 RepID=UPI0036C9FC5D
MAGLGENRRDDHHHRHLTNVWFGNTNLADAYCANADFTNIYYDQTTRWPPGYTPPASRQTP